MVRKKKKKRIRNVKIALTKSHKQPACFTFRVFLILETSINCAITSKTSSLVKWRWRRRRRRWPVHIPSFSNVSPNQNELALKQTKCSAPNFIKINDYLILSNIISLRKLYITCTRKCYLFKIYGFEFKNLR